jgi:predicted secreted protein
MSEVLGKTVLLDVKVGGSWVTVGGTRNHNLSINNDLLETTTKDTARWKTFKQNFSELEISLEGLYDPTKDIGPEEFLDYILAGSEFEIRYGQVNTAGAHLLTCSVVIQSYSEGSPHDGLATWDLTLKPNGEPTKVTVGS